MAKKNLFHHIKEILQSTFALELYDINTTSTGFSAIIPFGKDNKNRPLAIQLVHHSILPPTLEEDPTLPKIPPFYMPDILSFFLSAPFDIPLEKAHEIAWFLLLSNNKHLLGTYHYQPPHLVYFSYHIPLNSHIPSKKELIIALSSLLLAKNTLFPLVDQLATGEKCFQDFLEHPEEKPESEKKGS
jgi:hypothetical protein